MNNALTEIIYYSNYFFLFYFLAIGSIYIMLSVLSFGRIRNYFDKRKYKDLADIFKLKNYKTISLIVPAYNEESGIVDSINSLLQLEYPEFQVIVVNDGSKDNTLASLYQSFNLLQIPYLPYINIKTQPVNSAFISRDHPNLLIIDKQNGGKADAINAGLNAAENELILVIDADSILERDSLLKISRPFLENENVVAVGGTIRVANGCEINKGFISKIDTSKSWIARFQIVEYLRAFLFGRNGFDILNGILIISGAFSCFKRETIVEIGGYLTGSIGEDMEIIVRIHNKLRKDNPNLRISFIPDPVCWTEAPESLKILGRQRKRWQKGTIESLWLHKDLFFSRKHGALGFLIFPYYVIFELFGPIFEVLGYLLFIVSLIAGIVSLNFAVIFLSAAILYGIILSLLSVIFEELSFRKYPKVTHLLELFLAAVFENFGYRQILTWWRFVGTVEYLLGSRNWGKMEKKGFAVKPKQKLSQVSE